MTSVARRPLPELLPPVTAPPSRARQLAGPAAFAVLGLVAVLVLAPRAHGQALFGFTPEFAKVTVPNLSLPAALTCYVCGAVILALALGRLAEAAGLAPWLARRPRLARGWRLAAIALALFLFVVALLAWSDASQSTSAGTGAAIAINIVNLLSGSLTQSIPIMLGAITGVICSRSGVINIAIEGQLLLGAFCAAIATTATGSLWAGVACGALAGALVGALLAVFAIAYRVDQVVLGVVLNGLVAGLTGYLFNALMEKYPETLNDPATFSLVKIPALGDIPVIGPVLFDSSPFLYITYGVLAVVSFGLFKTRWGLRTRAVGEHPVAADTVGIRVLALRYRNVIAAGLIAGVGGAYFTIGSVGSFAINTSSGDGYIALAAMIFGRYNPGGAVLAALLFGFTTQLELILSSINVPIQSNLLLLAPYVVTIIVVAGLVGKVRGPRAEGVPYVKS